MIVGFTLIAVILLLFAQYFMNRAEHLGNAFVGLIFGVAGAAVAVLAFLKLVEYAGF